LNTWDDFLGPLITSVQKSLHRRARFGVVPQRLFIEWNIFLAAAAVAMAVPLIIFFIAQKYFIEGVQLTGAGGVKG
jgi:multiple sugar transport system permease protein